MSYSVAFSGSVGRFRGNGDRSATCDSSSESELYSESPTDSDSLEDSAEEADSAVGVLAELVEEGAGREVINVEPVRLSFFRTGSLARFHCPVPFSGFILSA